MKGLKRIVILCLTLAMALSVGACGKSGSSSQTVTITVWDDGSNIDMMETLAEEFVIAYKKDYPFAPAVKIEFVAQEEQSAVEKITNAGPAGNGPDIYAFVHDTLGTAVNSGLIAKNQYGDVIRATHKAEAVAAFSYQGELYGYPNTAESLTVMYDKSQISAEQLASMEGVKAAGKKLAWEINKEAYYPFGLFTDSVLFGENGTESKNLNLATDKTVRNLTSIVNDYKSVIESTDPDTGLTLLRTKQVAGVVSSPYLWPSVKEELGNNAGIAVLPTINGETQRPFSGYKGYGVSPYSKNPMIAHAFANYIVTADSQLYRFVQKKYLPTMDTKDLNDAVAADAEASVYMASLEASVAMPNILQMGKYWAPMEEAMTIIWNLSPATETEVRAALVSAQNSILK